MSKHTPGSEVDTAKSLIPALVSMRNDALKSNQFESSVILSHTIAHLKWTDKNDSLIAAAPEMLHLLNLISAEWQSDPMSVQCFDLQIVKDVKNLIKKAEGSTSSKD